MNTGTQKLHVVVVVLGDLGRSPRMQYHALSLLHAGHKVSLLGYQGEDLIPGLCDISLSHRLNVIRFHVPSPKSLRKLLVFYMIYRVIALCRCLLHALFVLVPAKLKEEVDCVLVQNPPALPLLFISYIYCRFQKLTRRLHDGPVLVIDWHNLGFSMLTNNLFAKICRHYERLMAPLADRHFCVTSAMKSFLENEFNVPNSSIQILYDCPLSMFQPLSTSDQHQLLTRLHTKFCEACPRDWHQHLTTPNQTLLTETTREGGHQARRGRPALVVSSTSWTPDEDFGQLLDALESLDKTIQRYNSNLNVLVVITGKGPLKLFYEERISQIDFEHVAVQTLWLEPVDYPRLLACADVGVSLHTSTSGRDLPMKVLDLFGCSVPVCARNFHCLSELVRDDENGRIFESSETLASQLWIMLRPLSAEPLERRAPHSFGDLAKYSKKLEGYRRWSQNWNECALPIILEAVEFSTRTLEKKNA